MQRQYRLHNHFSATTQKTTTNLHSCSIFLCNASTVYTTILVQQPKRLQPIFTAAVYSYATPVPFTQPFQCNNPKDYNQSSQLQYILMQRQYRLHNHFSATTQ